MSNDSGKGAKSGGMDRRTALRGIAAATFTVTATSVVPAAEARAEKPETGKTSSATPIIRASYTQNIVETTSGKVRGFESRGVRVFRGVFRLPGRAVIGIDIDDPERNPEQGHQQARLVAIARTLLRIECEHVPPLGLRCDISLRRDARQMNRLGGCHLNP